MMDILWHMWHSILWIINKQSRPYKLRQFKCPNFEIFLLPYWMEYFNKTEKDEDRAVCFYNSKKSNGALQIWTFTWENEFKNHSNSMLKKFLIWDLKRRLKGLNIPYNYRLVKKYELENHFFAETSFKKDGNYWRLWSVTTKKKSAHISYNYQLKFSDVSQKEVTQMIKTFRFIDV